MKLVVPLMIPAIHSIRFAVSPSRSALMIGMPPATAASNATMTPFSRAAAKISVPCTASSALLAVTTCLPAAIASSTSVARDRRCRRSARSTMSISGPAITARASAADLGARRRRRARARAEVEVGDLRDADLAPGAAPDLFLVALQDGERAAADDAGAEQADLDRLHAMDRLARPTSRVPRPVVREEGRDPAHRLDQVVGVGQEDDAEVVRAAAS